MHAFGSGRAQEIRARSARSSAAWVQIRCRSAIPRVPAQVRPGAQSERAGSAQSQSESAGSAYERQVPCSAIGARFRAHGRRAPESRDQRADWRVQARPILKPECDCGAGAPTIAMEGDSGSGAGAPRIAIGVRFCAGRRKRARNFRPQARSDAYGCLGTWNRHAQRSNRIAFGCNGAKACPARRGAGCPARIARQSLVRGACLLMSGEPHSRRVCMHWARRVRCKT